MSDKSVQYPSEDDKNYIGQWIYEDVNRPVMHHRVSIGTQAKLRLLAYADKIKPGQELEKVINEAWERNGNRLIDINYDDKRFRKVLNKIAEHKAKYDTHPKRIKHPHPQLDD